MRKQGDLSLSEGTTECADLGEHIGMQICEDVRHSDTRRMTLDVQSFQVEVHVEEGTEWTALSWVQADMSIEYDVANQEQLSFGRWPCTRSCMSVGCGGSPSMTRCLRSGQHLMTISQNR